MKFQHDTLPAVLRVCAWCQAEGKGPPPGPGQTHGICPTHMAIELATIKERLNAADQRARRP